MPFDSGFSDITRVSSQHILHRRRNPLGEDVDEIAIGAGQKARRHLDDGHLAAERRIDGPELEPDVAAADDE